MNSRLTRFGINFDFRQAWPSSCLGVFVVKFLVSQKGAGENRRELPFSEKNLSCLEPLALLSKRLRRKTLREQQRAQIGKFNPVGYFRRHHRLGVESDA